MVVDKLLKLINRSPPRGTLPTRQYILDDQGEPKNEPNLSKWGKWLATDPRRVLQQDKLPTGVLISTVFTGLDQRQPFFTPYDDSVRPPILWETMIFGGPHNEYCKRYASKDEALTGHQDAVRLAACP
jgi:hypothetical protein